MVISTRRFCARPEAVALEATGWRVVGIAIHMDNGLIILPQHDSDRVKGVIKTRTDICAIGGKGNIIRHD